MKKNQYLILSGVSLLLAGIVMIVSNNIGVSTSKILISLFFVISGILAFLFASTNPQVKIPSLYYKLIGIAFTLFGLLLYFYSNGLSDFLNYATYFILFLGFFDIVFGFSLVRSSFDWTWGKLLFKSIGALLGLIGGVAILATSITDQYSGLMITGIVTILMGLGTIFFASKIKTISIK